MKVDVTDYVNKHMDKKTISIILVNNQTTAQNHYLVSTKEATSGNVPKLVLAKS